MFDFLGRKLEIGDNVVAVLHQHTRSDLVSGEIIRFTPQKVVIKTIKNDWTFGYNEVMKTSPEKVIKITDFLSEEG